MGINDERSGTECASAASVPRNERLDLFVRHPDPSVLRFHRMLLLSIMQDLSRTTDETRQVRGY